VEHELSFRTPMYDHEKSRLHEIRLLLANLKEYL